MSKKRCPSQLGKRHDLGLLTACRLSLILLSQVQIQIHKASPNGGDFLRVARLQNELPQEVLILI